MSPRASPINSKTLYSCSSLCLCRAWVHQQPQWCSQLQPQPSKDARWESKQLCDLLSITSESHHLHPAVHASHNSATVCGDREQLWEQEGGQRPFSPQPGSAQPHLGFYWAIQKHACLRRVIAFCCGCYKIHWKHVWLEGHIKLLHLLSVHFFLFFVYI